MADEPVFISNPHLPEEMQGMEMKQVVMGPPGYASPDPMTNAQAMLPLHESGHDISDDFGAPIAGDEEKDAHAVAKKKKAKKSDDADAEA